MNGQSAKEDETCTKNVEDGATKMCSLQSKKTAFPSLSKAKYAKMMEVLDELVPQHRDEISARFCDILNYDPSLPRSTPERSAYVVAFIKKKAEKMGTSTYVAGGRQRAYWREKEERAAGKEQA